MREFVIFECQDCGSYTLDGPEEVIHLKQRCRGHAEPDLIDRLVAVVVTQRSVTDAPPADETAPIDGAVGDLAAELRMLDR